MATAVQRSARFNLRATRKQEKLIKLAAKETQSNVSTFVLESACLRAEEALASKQHFEIKPAQWSDFIAALDREPQQKPNLRKLLTEPSVLER
jgi:uncharacterized protein (DUF1778 family)